MKRVKKVIFHQKNKIVNQNSTNIKRKTVKNLRLRKQQLLPPIKESRRQRLKINVRNNKKSPTNK